MPETLGEKLRAAREERGVSVSEVAEQTRIAPMYIECIENDNYKPLPGGIFNKGFVKSYARFIGYDEQQALQEYSRLVTQTEGAQEDHAAATGARVAQLAGHVVARVLARNLPVSLVNHATGGHGFDLDEDTPVSRGIVQQVLAFLQLHLKVTFAE